MAVTQLKQNRKQHMLLPVKIDSCSVVGFRTVDREIIGYELQCQNFMKFCVKVSGQDIKSSQASMFREIEKQTTAHKLQLLKSGHTSLQTGDSK